ncbi:hypothetical protein DPMN_110071 [Dreissena polymorpha]|uniref:Reverse transcriptase domain-containing protein n=1 Tax=Dreissena polymorpha TaxID=45954 RepID=A0A9D4QMN5_DREPO|nr:hypothetical protein DPMN_110071 [Dreissena polymorpha]
MNGTETSISYLSHYIQSNKHIQGISLEPDEEIKQSLFPDDATYFLNDSSDSFNHLIESLTLFGMASGLKLNTSKCTVLRGALGDIWAWLRLGDTDYTGGGSTLNNLVNNASVGSKCAGC